jgi:hypothetical protein
MAHQYIREEIMKLWLLLLFLCFFNHESFAEEIPLQPKCEVQAEILSISNGKFFWNQNEFYQYFDVGIKVKNIKPLEKSDEVLACSPLKEESRTDIVRIWDWSNKEVAWKYENGTMMAPHDVVKLELTNSYVGDGSWPTVIGAEPVNK